MIRKKIIKVVAIFMLSCMVLGGMNVYATSQPLKFSFTVKNQKLPTAEYAKEDSEQNAYVTLQDTDYSDFMAGDVFGCTIRKSGTKTQMTNYTNIKKIGKYKLPYIKKGKRGTKYYLNGQIDSSSKSSKLRVQGYWLP